MFASSLTRHHLSSPRRLWKLAFVPNPLIPLGQLFKQTAGRNLGIPMKREDIDRCQIQEWYPEFKSISIKALIHELPEPFVQYLLDDTGPFLLPLSNQDALPKRIHKPEEEEDFVASEGSGDEAEEPEPPPSFPELEAQVQESIKSLGGSVIPKLNWSSPKDAAWISSTGSLRCTSFSEIALLLKSSDSIVHDLCHAYDSCIGPETPSRPPVFYLGLRKWYPNLNPEMEFRCFVRDGALVGISQREVTGFYPVLAGKKPALRSMIRGFFVEEVAGKFGSERYVFDIYVTRDGRVRVLDFNPWGGSTLPLMFTWEELEGDLGGDGEVEFRVVEGRCGIRPGLKTAVPFDYLDMSDGSGWDQFLRNADVEARRQDSRGGAGA